MGGDLERDVEVRGHVVAVQRLEDEDDVDGRPVQGKHDDDENNHPRDPLLPPKALVRDDRAGRNGLPEPVEHRTVQEADDQERDGVGGDEKD